MKIPVVVFHNKILLSVHTQNLTHTVKYVMRCKPYLLTNRNSPLNYDTSLLQPPCNNYYFSRPVTIPPHSKGSYTEIEQDLTLSTQGCRSNASSPDQLSTACVFNCLNLAELEKKVSFAVRQTHFDCLQKLENPNGPHLFKAERLPPPQLGVAFVRLLVTVIPNP